MTIEEIVAKYHSRAIGILSKIRESLSSRELAEPVYLGDELMRWVLFVPVSGSYDEPAEDDIEILVCVLDSEECDGTENGVNFGLSTVTVGGRILGDLVPYNYSDKVWVPRDDEIAVEERFTLLENCVDPDNFAEWLSEI